MPQVQGAFPIGRLSEQTGVHIETIRYYERIGLLPRPPRTGGGFRVYEKEDARRLSFIKRSRDLGFTLDEVRELLKLASNGMRSCGAVHKLASAHLVDVRAKIVDLRRLERVLRSMVAACAEGTLPECPLLEALNS